MKKPTHYFKFLCLLLATTLIFSCSSDDDGITIQKPTVTYSATNLESVFFTEGNSPEPSVDWNGNTGSFSLSTGIDGLSIDSSTGVISWTGVLPPGTHNFEVIATNSAGQIAVGIQLDNPVQSFLTGTYSVTGGSSGNYFAIDFHVNGTLDIFSNDPDNPTEASGTWVRTDNEIKVDYTYNDVGDEYSLSGTLTQHSTATLEYSGTWYDGHGAVSGNEGGDFEVWID